MTTRKPLSTTSLAFGLVLVSLLAGCGGRSSSSTSSSGVQTHAGQTTPTRTTALVLRKGAYDRMMRQLGHTLAASFARMYPIVETQPGDTASLLTVAKVERARAVVVSVNARISAIVPPAPVRDDDVLLMKGLRELEQEFDQLIDVLKHGGPKPFGAYASFAGLKMIEQATAAIEKKGYAIS